MAEVRAAAAAADITVYEPPSSHTNMDTSTNTSTNMPTTTTALATLTAVADSAGSDNEVQAS